MSLSVFAPASIGNVSVGFDLLGLAVKPIDGTYLGDVISIEAAEKDQLMVVGQFASKLPSAYADNIVWHCLQLFNDQLRQNALSTKTVALTLDKKMPVGSGLGSSACSIVAALFALNEFYDKPFSSQALLEMMGQMEASISGSLHYDNVAPCFLGGLQLMLPQSQNICQSLPTFDDCYWVMAYPGIEVSTKMAREVLPEKYNKSSMIQAMQNLASFVDGCHRGDKSQAMDALVDVVAEPYRESLIPRFSQAKQTMLSNGALASGISGSGPTLFAVFEDVQKAQEQAAWLTKEYLQSEHGFVHVCRADTDGAMVI